MKALYKRTEIDRDPGVAAYKNFQTRQDEAILKTGMTAKEYFDARMLLQANGTITGNLRNGTFDSKGNLAKPTGLRSWDEDLAKLGKNISKLEISIRRLCWIKMLSRLEA